jgi:ribosome-binding ATPase YchF (GTP1/OBG family)
MTSQRTANALYHCIQINGLLCKPQAAGVIHSDFERGFIRAETVSYQDLVDCGSEKVLHTLKDLFVMLALN